MPGAPRPTWEPLVAKPAKWPPVDGLEIVRRPSSPSSRSQGHRGPLRGRPAYLEGTTTRSRRSGAPSWLDQARIESTGSATGRDIEGPCRISWSRSPVPCSYRLPRPRIRTSTGSRAGSSTSPRPNEIVSSFYGRPLPAPRPSGSTAERQSRVATPARRNRTRSSEGVHDVSQSVTSSRVENIVKDFRPGFGVRRKRVLHGISFDGASAGRSSASWDPNGCGQDHHPQDPHGSHLVPPRVARRSWGSDVRETAFRRQRGLPPREPVLLRLPHGPRDPDLLRPSSRACPHGRDARRGSTSCWTGWA